VDRGTRDPDYTRTTGDPETPLKSPPSSISACRSSRRLRRTMFTVRTTSDAISPMAGLPSSVTAALPCSHVVVRLCPVPPVPAGVLYLESGAAAPLPLLSPWSWRLDS
jgi:hypothetical protein